MENSPFRIPKVTQSGMPERLFERVLGLKELENRYKKLGGGCYKGRDFLKLVLNSFDIEHNITAGSKDAIPSSGSAVIVANHPFGGIEGVALADMLLSIRDDVKVLTNELLCRIPDLQDVFIGVDILSKERREKNKKTIAKAQQWVNDGHLLLIFPAGEVSSYDKRLRQVADPKWRPTAARIIRNTHASVTPVFVEGSNGWLFQLLGFMHPTLRTVRLVRELINKQGRTINFRIGTCRGTSDLAQLDSDKALTNYLRLNTYLLANQRTTVNKYPFINKKPKQPLDIASPIAVDKLKQDIAHLSAKSLLMKKGDMEVYCARATHIPNVLREIGRLREITFREVGEGTGDTLDLDHYDQYYLHLFLWNTRKAELVGAYRIGEIDKIVREHGIHGIYSRSLFKYHQNFLQRIGSCLEMGRSFVRAEYQKSLSPLLLLWKGIGAFVSANPSYKTLFGPVSISSDYTEVSRHLMASCLEVNNSDQNLMALVQPTTPLKSKKVCFWKQADLEGLGDIDKLSSLVKQIEVDNKGVPVLLRQYLKLQGELAAFNVDPDFNNALDGLIIVDLTRVNQRVLGKYMGPEKAAAYHDYHNALA